MSKMHIKMTVNGQQKELLSEPRQLLIHVLREELGLTGPHIGCETSHCGACTVELNGKSVKSCTVFAAQADGAEVTTVEGLGNPDGLHLLQEMFKEHHGLQRGFCTPGMITRTHTRARTGCCRKTRTRPRKSCGSAWPATCAAAPDTRTS